MSDRAFFFTWHAVRRQLAAMPNDFYFIRLIHRATRRVCPGERLWDVGQLTRGSVLRFLRARNLQGFDVYLWPYAEHGNAGYILLDLDHAAADVILRMRANGHEPCVLLQTSPGHLQAWIRVSTTPLEPALATLVSKQLAHTYGGDLASTDWHHLGRLAGFTNQKPFYRAPFGSAPWVKVLYADVVLARASQDLLRTAERLAQQATPATSDLRPPVFPDTPSTEISAHAARCIYQHWVARWRIRDRFARPDWSIVDLWLARKLLAMHITPAQVRAVLRLGSPDFPRHHGDPEDYLRRTLARAALPAKNFLLPQPVCSAHTATAAPRAARAETDSDCSKARGER